MERELGGPLFARGRCHTHLTDRLSDRLLSGEFDAAMVSRPDCYGERLNADLLYAERTMVACAPDHPFAQRESITMADMDEQTYLMRINCEIRSLLADRLREVGARLNVVCRSEHEDWIQSLVAGASVHASCRNSAPLCRV